MPISMLFPLVYLVVVVLAGYWVIRLAVRHALQDADNRRAAEAGGPPTTPE